MRLCSYIVKKDTGLAPNPFWGYCTLAVCTPNHMGIRAELGDWFLGTTTSERGNKLLYAMEVLERLYFDAYFKAPRFNKKKPVINGTWRQRCGDNMYFKDSTGNWEQHPSLFHGDKKVIRKDLKNPYVFTSKHFYYFGNKAFKIPAKYSELIWRTQGVKCSHDPKCVKGFLNWLKTNYKPGIHGEPIDRERNSRASSKSKNVILNDCNLLSRLKTLNIYYLSKRRLTR